MSNQIRPRSPVFREGESALLEIVVDPATAAYTWVVAAQDPHEGDYVVDSGWLPKSGTRKPPSTSSIASTSVLAAGNYAVRLFAGKPAAPDELSSFLASAQLLDEDTFAVVGEGVDAEPGSPASRVTFGQLREFLGAGRAAAEQHADVSPPDLESSPYAVLRDAARAIVGQSTLSEFRDLVPTEFLQNTGGDATIQFPDLVAVPLDPGQAYLPAVELIWNYWLEEGMLVQTIEVVLARFQNLRATARDPLARFDLTPLLPLRNLLWGYAEDEAHRITVRRRAAEYEYEYGLRLSGSRPTHVDAVVERRSRFVETFHQVLHLGHRYLRDLDNLAMQADAFPLCLALRDCHLVTSQSAHNQYGEMAVAARAEFLVMQSLLGDPQMREFLGGRPMTAYPEPWMDRVDTMKSIQGWTDTSILHFHDLATIGEQLVLAIRLGNWADPATNANKAATWARAFRADLQRYTAAYRAVTGIDLAREANTELPSTLIARKEDGSNSANYQHDVRRLADTLRTLANELEVEASTDDC